jgi:hypothetical protein
VPVSVPEIAVMSPHGKLNPVPESIITEVSRAKMVPSSVIPGQTDIENGHGLRFS